MSFKKIVTALALLAVVPCTAADSATAYSLVVYTADGSQKAYDFASNPRLTIIGQTFRITADGHVTDYVASDLLRFTLEDAGGNLLPQSYWLVVSLRDGTIEGYPFANRPTVTIKDNLFKVTTTTHTVDYPAKSVERFRLTDSYDVPTVDGDVNADGAVDVADISSVISVMASDGNDPLSVRADVNGDGAVDVADIAEIISIMASGK